MKMASIKIGQSGADAFLLLDDESVGRIIRALVYMTFQGELPAVPKHLRPVFYQVYAESCRCRDKKPLMPTEIEFADNADEAANAAKAANAANAAIRRRARRAEVEVEKEVDTDDTADAVSSGTGGLRSAVSTSPLSCDDDLKEKSYDAWASLQTDPVDIALDITGEPTQKRRVYGARLKALGRDRFVETCCTFRAEVAAGESVRNLGAALTKRLNDAILAKEVCAG